MQCYTYYMIWLLPLPTHPYSLGSINAHARCASHPAHAKQHTGHLTPRNAPDRANVVRRSVLRAAMGEGCATSNLHASRFFGAQRAEPGTNGRGSDLDEHNRVRHLAVWFRRESVHRLAMHATTQTSSASAEGGSVLGPDPTGANLSEGASSAQNRLCAAAR